MTAPESLATTLHAQIVNLPDGIQPEAPNDDFIRGFRFGHRAARHSAAELVSAALASSAPAVAAPTHIHEAWWLIESNYAPVPLYYAGHKKRRDGAMYMHMVDDAAKAVRFPDEWPAKYAAARLAGIDISDLTWPLKLASAGYNVTEHIFDYTPAALSSPAPAAGADHDNRFIRELLDYCRANQGTYVMPGWDGDRVLKYLASPAVPAVLQTADGVMVGHAPLADGFDGSTVRPGPNHSTIEIWYDTQAQARAAHEIIRDLIDAAHTSGVRVPDGGQQG